MGTKRYTNPEGTCRRQLSQRDELWLKSLLLDSVCDAVVAHTCDGELVYFNEAAARQRGHTPEEFANVGKWGWISPESRETIDERVAEIRRSGAPPPFVTRSLRKDGRPLCTEVHTRMVEVDGEDLLVSVVRDVTDRIAAEEQVRHLAYHDALTGLANRLAFEERLEDAADEATRRGCFGVIYLDLDEFKPVNDRFGHAIGDAVLQVVAKRLIGRVRESDTVGRLGGDEFGVLVTQLSDGTCDEELRAIAEHLTASLAEPIAIGNVEVRITASSGCAAWESGLKPGDLLGRADLDMYAEKLRRRERVDGETAERVATSA